MNLKLECKTLLIIIYIKFFFTPLLCKQAHKLPYSPVFNLRGGKGGGQCAHIYLHVLHMSITVYFLSPE